MMCHYPRSNFSKKLQQKVTLLVVNNYVKKDDKILFILCIKDLDKNL